MVPPYPSGFHLVGTGQYFRLTTCPGDGRRDGATWPHVEAAGCEKKNMEKYRKVLETYFSTLNFWV